MKVECGPRGGPGLALNHVAEEKGGERISMMERIRYNNRGRVQKRTWSKAQETARWTKRHADTRRAHTELLDRREVPYHGIGPQDTIAPIRPSRSSIWVSIAARCVRSAATLMASIPCRARCDRSSSRSTYHGSTTLAPAPASTFGHGFAEPAVAPVREPILPFRHRSICGYSVFCQNVFATASSGEDGDGARRLPLSR